MKCPKCGYLGFETSDRCRHCGYDFSLSPPTEATAELPLRSGDGSGAALADLDLAEAHVPGTEELTLEIARPKSQSTVATVTPPDLSSSVRPRVASAAPQSASDALPLFAEAPEEAPSIPPPRAGAPLAVRRTTPEIPRGRSRSVTQPRPAKADDLLASTGVRVADERLTREAEDVRDTGLELRAAGRAARLTATMVDGILLALIDAVVIYLTLALTGLPASEVMRLPVLPLAGFLLILDGGYLIAFVVAGGQTIGKMLTGVRVVGDDGRRVDIGGAVLRAVGCLLSLLSAGLGYLPAFAGVEGRALHDRLSGTRVVSAR